MEMGFIAARHPQAVVQVGFLTPQLSGALFRLRLGVVDPFRMGLHGLGWGQCSPQGQQGANSSVGDGRAASQRKKGVEAVVLRFVQAIVLQHLAQLQNLAALGDDDVPG